MARTYRDRYAEVRGEWSPANRTFSTRRRIEAAVDAEREWAEPEPAGLDLFEDDDDPDDGFERWLERQAERDWTDPVIDDCDDDLWDRFGAQDDDEQCLVCGGPAMPLGPLGNLLHFRCRNCGAEQSRPAVREVV